MEETSLSSILLRGAAVLVLLAANAFFVAAEFALVASRKTRIAELVRQGDRQAKTAQAAMDDLYRQLSAAQLGITLASILLGYVAEETVAVMLRGWISSLPAALGFLARGAFASVVAVAAITALHVVVGEQTPKAWAITFPEATARWIAAPLILFSWLTRPVTNLLNFSSNRLVRLLGIKGTVDETHSAYSLEEIVMLARETKELDDEDVEMIEGVLEFTEETVREVMTPRTEIAALSVSTTVADALDTVAEVGRSRYPVYRGSPDDIVGIVHVKQILEAFRLRPSDVVESVMGEVLYVPGTREVEDVLADLKRLKTHMAVVLDEYGGTAGIVTMEDLLEEIVGEIYDEYDEAEPAPAAAPDSIRVPGDTEIDDLNKRFGFSLSDSDYKTIGGFVFGQLGRLPHAGDTVELADMTLEVLAMDRRRVAWVKIVPQPQEGDNVTTA